MTYDGKIIGRYVELRSVTEEDAEFTLSLRQDPMFAKFLPHINIKIEEQRAWIYKQRKMKGDYFFLACNKDESRLGTVSVYNIEGDRSESGRLALRGDALQNTEATLLLFKFSFEILKLNEITGFVYADNKRAIRFNQKFGCVLNDPEPDENGKMICKTNIQKDNFYLAEKRLEKLLYRI